MLPGIVDATKYGKDISKLAESSLRITYERFSDVRIVMSLGLQFQHQKRVRGSTIDTVRRINGELVDSYGCHQVDFRGKGVCSHF